MQTCPGYWLVVGWLVAVVTMAAAPPRSPNPGTPPAPGMVLIAGRWFRCAPDCKKEVNGETKAEETKEEGTNAEETREEDQGPRFVFTPRGEQTEIVPFTHGDARTEEGKAVVAPDANTLTVTITGGVGANVFLGAHSEAFQTFHLIQGFEVTHTDPSVRQMVLSLDSKLLGFVRSKHRASACVRLACLTVTPAGSSRPVLSISHPLPCVGGACGLCDPPLGSQSKDPLETIRSQPLPLGTYVIEAHFILTATAEGFLDAHSTAIFAPEPTELDPWEREHDPFNGEKKDGYGFTTVLTATTPDAPAPTGEATWNTVKKRLAKEKKARQEAKRLAARSSSIR